MRVCSEGEPILGLALDSSIAHPAAVSGVIEPETASPQKSEAHIHTAVPACPIGQGRSG